MFTKRARKELDGEPEPQSRWWQITRTALYAGGIVVVGLLANRVIHQDADSAPCTPTDRVSAPAVDGKYPEEFLGERFPGVSKQCISQAAAIIAYENTTDFPPDGMTWTTNGLIVTDGRGGQTVVTAPTPTTTP